MIIEINENNFEKEVLEEKGKVLVDFWAPWCNPCRMMHPVLEELEKEIAGSVKVAKINVDDNQGLAARFGIMSIPTFMVFENGKQLASSVGMQTKEDLIKLLS